MSAPLPPTTGPGRLALRMFVNGSGQSSARAADAEPRGEERIDEGGGADHRPIHAAGERLAGALDRGDAAHRENGPVPGPRLSPREQLLDLHAAVVPHRLARNARELSARPCEGG